MILAVLVAVVSSMSLHHGAMARTSGVEHAVSDVNHHADVECEAHCDSDPHSMPVCCGMGLCLGGMPAAPSATLPVLRTVDRLADVTEPAPHRVIVRIDRPPKGFRTDA